jgi:4-diphosphocytidyl-2-C-methyl-D-erythritol kinase
VLERRADGFHSIWSVMQTVGLDDALTVSVHADGTGRVALQCNRADLAVDQTNLVYRAAQLVLNRSRLPVNVFIDLAKRIPMGAGLGGGSSDAAATILALNRALSLGWSDETMMEIGQQLGSDVPFFFAAPAACVAGRGERVQRLQVSDRRWALLVNPGFPVETKWAYQQLSASRKAVHPVSDTHRRLAVEDSVTWSQLSRLAENDFEGPVFEKHPILKDIKEGFLTDGAESALLCGSGATVFGIFADKVAAERAGSAWIGRPGMMVFVVPTCNKGIEITAEGTS